MDSVIEKRKSLIINFVYTVICVGLFYVFIKYCLGVLSPFIVAFVLAYALQRPIKWAKKKLHLKSHGIISFLLVLLVVLIVMGVLSIAVLVLFNELKDFASYLTTQFSSIDELIVTLENYAMGVIVRLPEGIRETVGDYVTDAFDSLGKGQAELDLSMLSAPLSGAWSVVKSLPSTILSIVVAVVSCFFMASDYDKVKDLFLSFFSESKRKSLVKTKRTAIKAIAKLLIIDVKPESDEAVKIIESGSVITFEKISVDTFLKEITAKSEIVSQDGKTVASDADISSGMKIVLKNESGKIVDEKTIIVPGDVDCDGSISASDARAALRRSVGLDVLKDFQETAADVNHDGKITSMDAREILRASVGLVDKKDFFNGIK